MYNLYRALVHVCTLNKIISFAQSDSVTCSKSVLGSPGLCWSFWHLCRAASVCLLCGLNSLQGQLGKNYMNWLRSTSLCEPFADLLSFNWIRDLFQPIVCQAVEEEERGEHCRLESLPKTMYY